VSDDALFRQLATQKLRVLRAAGAVLNLVFLYLLLPIIALVVGAVVLVVALLIGAM
jgi:hypothetical protein